MATARHARSNWRSGQFRQVCDAIGRELRANYLPISREAIPAELNELLTLIVALETQTIRRRGEPLQAAEAGEVAAASRISPQ